MADDVAVGIDDDLVVNDCLVVLKVDGLDCVVYKEAVDL